VTRRLSSRLALGLLCACACACAMAPAPVAADWPLRGVVLADMGAARPGATFFAPPWLWVGTGQPVLSSPLWASQPGAAASLAPGPWRPEPAFDTRLPGVMLVVGAERVGTSQAGNAGSVEAWVLNFNNSAILNVGVRHAW
jgi:hypothetical protein